jgi:hypothetical protein
MKHIHTYESFLNESIRAEEAHRDENAIQTVIDGKRDVGFLTIIGSTMSEKDIWDMIKGGGLKTIQLKGNTHKGYIYYKPGAEKNAKELENIANKYGGYLAWDATEQDSRRIGELLNYDKRDIDWYINKNYK